MKSFIAIDLKSFYASVECRERNLNPLDTHLVVADASRTEKTICLAVSPSLKAYGVPGRARLFEVVEKVREANIKRHQAGKCFGRIKQQSNISKTQAASAEEKLPQTQVALKEEKLPQTQAALKEKNLPQTQAASAEEKLPQTQVALKEEKLPQTQAALKEEKLPQTKVALEEKNLPQMQAVSAEENLFPGRAFLPEKNQFQDRNTTAEENNSLLRTTLAENPQKQSNPPSASHFASELAAHPEYDISYIIARPRMALYMQYSTRIYQIYLKYIAPEDIHVYSIDEVLIDATPYLATYKLTAHELAMKLIREVYKETGITATAGIGSNLYLAKIAMDIVAKHMPADEQGVRIAELDEMSYRKQLWDHKPLTDFWRVGRGYAKKLAEVGIYTMGDVARCSLGESNDFYNEELLYKLFGVNAELLIDHAWGYEPCSLKAIKAYKPESNSTCMGQVLNSPYDYEMTKTVLLEMAELLALDLVDKELVTDQCVLTIEYDIENLTDPARKKKYKGPVTKDMYGRSVPKHAHGTVNLTATSSYKEISEKVMELYERIMNPDLLSRKIYLTANHLTKETEIKKEEKYEQLDLFTDYKALEEKKKKREKDLAKEKDLQKAMLDIKRKYGKNAVLKGLAYREGATTKERNESIGGHHE